MILIRCSARSYDLYCCFVHVVADTVYMLQQLAFTVESARRICSVRALVPVAIKTDVDKGSMMVSVTLNPLNSFCFGTACM
jgi:hypothetical protein